MTLAQRPGRRVLLVTLVVRVPAPTSLEPCVVLRATIRRSSCLGVQCVVAPRLVSLGMTDGGRLCNLGVARRDGCI